MRQLAAMVALLFLVLAGASYPLPASAQAIDPCYYDANWNYVCVEDDGTITTYPNPFFDDLDRLVGQSQFLGLSAFYNGTALASGSPVNLTLNQDGSLAWSYDQKPPVPYAPFRNTPISFDNTLAHADLTFDIYQGTVGSSTLIFSQTIPYGQTPALPVRFTAPGPYVLAFSVTYPDDREVPGLGFNDLCTGGTGDICALPHFLLTPFRDFIQRGIVNSGTGVSTGYYIPAAFGLLPFSIGTAPSAIPNVLFLPGIEGSRLYRPDYNGGTDKLWEPDFFSNDIPDLYLSGDGTAVRDDIYVREGDIIESIPSKGSVYGALEQDFESLKQQGKIGEWEAIPYDWRLSIDELLTKGNNINGRIYYAGPLAATSTPYIIQELRRLGADGHKVTIVAHSNGGLIAKRLTQLLGDQEASQLIDKIILVASPQAGAPQAIASALHGDDQSLLFGILLSKNSARTFASTTPMTYTLLPSASYFTQVDDPVVSFDPNLTEWITRYGQTIHSEVLLDTFLTGSYGRVDAKKGNIDHPIQLDPRNILIQQANQLHSILDTWTAPSGIQVIQIAGWGIPSTISGINYRSKGSGIEPDPITTVDGDGTVPVPSALWTNGPNVTNYWLNLSQFNREHPIITGFGGIAPRKHATIFDVSELRQFVTDQITGPNEASYNYFSAQVPLSDSTKRLRYALHSPLTLDLYDDIGRHTGISTTTGEVEENIPNSYFLKVGDVKYVFTDENTPVHVNLRGYATSTFTLRLDELQSDTVVASTTFKDLPVSPQTSVRIDIGNNLQSVSPLLLDRNGDGTTDLTLLPKLNDVVTVPPDVTPPEARIGLDWSQRSLLIYGIDDQSPTTTAKLQNLATSTVLVDDAGHTLKLTYSKNEQKTDRAFLTLASLAYDSGASTTTASFLRNYWAANAKGGNPLVFLTFAKTKQEGMVALYLGAVNKTFIFKALLSDETADPKTLATSLMLRPRDIIKQYVGLVIPSLMSQKGKVNISY